jgi:hypothetical protein
MSWNLVKYVIKAAVHDRLVISMFSLIVVATSLSIFMASSAVTETDQFALVFAAGGLRMTSVVGLVLFVVFHMRRSFDTKDVEYLLSRPISRVSFIISHAVAFSFIAFIMAIIVIAAVVIVSPNAFSMGHILWGASLIAEFIIIVNVALFFSMVLTAATSGALAVLALYVLGRLMGQLLGIIESGIDAANLEIFSNIFKLISMVIPRLDLMAQTSWLIYEPDGTVGYLFIVIQLVVFSSLVICASIVDLVRRQF